MDDSKPTIAYFTMEIGLRAGIPTYSGGLGVLAGDTVRSAADLGVPMVAVTMLHRKGYFHQRLDADGSQTEEPVDWAVADFLQECSERASVTIEGREVRLRAWRADVKGVGGGGVPVLFLDSDLPENSAWDRTLTHHLYGGDEHYRLCQEVVLGIGGVRLLRALGYRTLNRYHMNEGHPSLLTLELLREGLQEAGRGEVRADDLEAVRRACVFTTHTPVPSGHDQYRLEQVVDVLDRGGGDPAGRVLAQAIDGLKDSFCYGGCLNMTYLALNMSHYVNGVAKRHGEVSRQLFGGYGIDSITNGVHAASWTAKSFSDLFDIHIPGWRQDNFSLRNALAIPKAEVWEAHAVAKRELLAAVNHETNLGMETGVLTLGFARRAAAYKRADLLFEDVERLRRLAARFGGLQVVYSGKAHPQDGPGKDLIRRIFRAKQALKMEIKIAYLQSYNMELGRLMTAGADVWLNTPEPPLEASGTSGMKAALNGVPSLSVLDGWWLEGCVEGVTGWAVGDGGRGAAAQGERSRDADSLYDKLERVVLPLYYEDRDGFIDVMRHAIALNGSFFNTQRMLQQYVVKAYLR